MNTHDLVAFVAVVETGSIVAASARLNLTQPGVTRRVQNLEDLLGTELLDRQSKPLKPTPAGREAYEHGRRVLRSLEDLKSGVAADGMVRGEFRLGITPYLSETGLSGPLDTLRAEFSALGIRIISGWSPDQVERVSRNQLDAAAVCLPDGIAPPAELESDDLGIHPVVFVVPRNQDIANVVSLEEISRLPWVINQDGCGFRGALKRQFDAAHLPFHVAVEALDSDLRLSLVARGLGVGVVTPVALRRSPYRAKLKAIKVKGFEPAVRAWIVHRPPAGRLAQPIKVFRDALDIELRKHVGK
ncbi:DNA-binding transcriptional LysR family regulator [Nitrobacteraceae bacterium AZCC 1564]